MNKILIFALALALTGARLAAQASADEAPQAPAGQDAPAGDAADAPHDRIFGIIPNYRTSPTLKDYEPLMPRAKFAVGKDDALDRGTFVLAALFAADGQLTKSSPSFGHGVAAYSRYYAAGLTDFVVGDFMTESVYPAALHQDPRYFRKGSGAFLVRLGYAVGQIFWTHTDSGGSTFNASEIVGNATAVGISNAYYPDGRNLSSNASKLGVQIGIDVVANILKEFSPDLDRAFSKPRRSSGERR